MAENYRN